MSIQIFKSALRGPCPAVPSRKNRFALVRRARNESAVLYVRASVATLKEAEALAAYIPLAVWDSHGWDIMRQDSSGRLYSLNSDSFNDESADQVPATASSLAAVASLTREV